MNKRECIAMIKAEQNRMWNESNSIDKHTETYEKVKKICADNGYVGGCFEDLWNRASTERAREAGLPIK